MHYKMKTHSWAVSHANVCTEMLPGAADKPIAQIVSSICCAASCSNAAQAESSPSLSVSLRVGKLNLQEQRMALTL